MIIFDASQSMAAADADRAGLRRIDSVRAALARILPAVAARRRLGLMTYGPGTLPACVNVSLAFRPQADAAKRILDAVSALKPAGRTPLTRAVRLAAEALSYRERPGTIVLLTDGEETCGGASCALVKELKGRAAGLTIHVVSYRIKDSLGSDGTFESRCLADETGGLYIDAGTVDELGAALQKVLSCPEISERPANRRFKTRSAAIAP
jgi:Ca-activated chloride channel family protein